MTPDDPPAPINLDEILALIEAVKRLPVLDDREPDAILGYNADGLPT